MKPPCVFIPVLIILSATSTTARVQPSTCPGGDWPSGIITQLVDTYGPRDALANTDPNSTFFEKILLFKKDEIEEQAHAAMNFFNETFGLDFSLSPEDESGNRFIPGAVFRRYTTDPSLSYRAVFNRWLVNGNTKSTCFDTRAGGFQVFFFAERMVYGTFGGSEGVAVFPTDSMSFGYYSILVCPQQPLVMHYRSASPVRTTADGYCIVNFNLFRPHEELSLGFATALARILPTADPNVFYYSLRNVFTFPPHPPGIL